MTTALRFLVDECTGPAVARWLREQGYDAVSAYDDLSPHFSPVGYYDGECIRSAYVSLPRPPRRTARVRLRRPRSLGVCAAERCIRVTSAVGPDARRGDAEDVGLIFQEPQHSRWAHAAVTLWAPGGSGHRLCCSSSPMHKDIDSSSRLVCDHKTLARGRTVLPRRLLALPERRCHRLATKTHE